MPREADNRGNITSETRNSVTVSYEYDALNQLVRVNDPNDLSGGENGTTWVYTYDRGGNITNKARYKYSTAAQPSEFVSQDIYSYEDGNWKDKLTDTNGITVDYDANGNPTDHWGWEYTWEKGRQLKKAHYIYGDPITLEFKYNKSGLRTQKVKKVGEVITDYVMSNKTLISMKKGNDTIYFSYDMSGSAPAMVTYNGARYTYVKNLLGDVVALLDSSGNIVCEYKYDAWGNPLSTTGSMAQTIGKLNPFRYRSYIWDEDMESYYLRSRYYDPVLCRFLQADALLTMNAFAYANNNPVMKVDADGTRASDNGSTTVAILLHCNGLSGTGWHYSMEIAGINFSFGDPDGNNKNEFGEVSVNYGEKVWDGKKTGFGICVLVVDSVPYEVALEGIAYWVNITHGKDIADEVRSSNDVYALFGEKGWFGKSKLTSGNYAYVFETFPCIAPIVESLEAMGIEFAWGDCFKADHIGDIEHGYQKHKTLGHSDFRPAYVFRNIYMPNTMIMFTRRNANGLYEAYKP